jgi:hypothetical protein
METKVFCRREVKVINLARQTLKPHNLCYEPLLRGILG